MTSSPRQDDRPPLTRDRILDAALVLVDEYGMDGLSMRRLGAALGVEAMSIYNHVASKHELLNGVVEKVLNEVEIPEPGGDWTQRIKEMARSYRKVAQAHPNVMPLMAMRPFANLPTLPLVEEVFATLANANIAPEDSLAALRAVASYAVGFTTSEVAGFVDDPAAYVANPSFDIESLSSFPHLLEMVPLMSDIDNDSHFEFGLDVCLQGIKAKLGV
ncbi:MAG TPA: TetR/AcrR family transcriptional regulator C-terminal domain-containing protein [Actinomycetota bacterium]|nr:TetR/AcrR family transcriptional regulator C-terminal domain-containing protein [Actinomycetota bacterium]